MLVVPSNISDQTLALAAKHRSKGRIPVLTYYHRANAATITRSSQPMVGIAQNRSFQDERLVEAIFFFAHESGCCDYQHRARLRIDTDELDH